MRFARIFDCRGQPGGWYLSFASPKERYQRKGDPIPPPLRGSLRCSPSRAAAQLALTDRTKRGLLRSSDSARRLPPAWLRYSAVEKGNPKSNFKTLSGQSPDSSKTPPRALRVTARSQNPFCAASGWQSNWDEGEHCLSSAAGHALCAPLGRVAQPPNLTANPKEPRRGGAAGCPSLGLLSLGQAREGN